MTESNINNENSFLIFKGNVLMYVAPEATLRKDLGARRLFRTEKWGNAVERREGKTTNKRFILTKAIPRGLLRLSPTGEFQSRWKVPDSNFFQSQAGDLGYVYASQTLPEGSFQSSLLSSSSLGHRAGLATGEKPWGTEMLLPTAGS